MLWVVTLTQDLGTVRETAPGQHRLDLTFAVNDFLLFNAKAKYFLMHYLPESGEIHRGIGSRGGHSNSFRSANPAGFQSAAGAASGNDL